MPSPLKIHVHQSYLSKYNHEGKRVVVGTYTDGDPALMGISAKHLIDTGHATPVKDK